MLREVDIDVDAPGAVRLLALVNSEFVYSVESFRHNWASSPPDAFRRAWCVEAEGEIVGWSTTARLVETSQPGVGWIVVSVHPDRRGAGLGAALLARAERHARDIGLTRLLSFSRADEASAGFPLRHGYEQTESNEILVCDPRRIEAPVAPAGVEILFFRDVAADPRPIYEVDKAAMPDEPGEAHFDAMTYEHWHGRFFSNPLVDHDASVLVTVDGRPVTYTMLMLDRETRRGQNNGTGTVPEFRGRGLALLAKRASLARAAELGCTAVYTGNNAVNAPMLSINRKLGFRVCGAELSWAKNLGATSAP